MPVPSSASLASTINSYAARVGSRRSSSKSSASSDGAQQEKIHQLDVERAQLLEYILSAALAQGKVKLPAGGSLETLDWTRISVSYVLDCLRTERVVIIPLAWTLQQKVETAAAAGPPVPGSPHKEPAHIEFGIPRSNSSSQACPSGGDVPLGVSDRKLSVSTLSSVMTTTTTMGTSGRRPLPTLPSMGSTMSASSAPLMIPQRRDINEISSVISVTTTAMVSETAPTVDLPSVLASPIDSPTVSPFSFPSGAFDEPPEYVFPVHWEHGNRLLAESNPNDWRHVGPPLPSPYTPDFAESVYELAVFVTRYAPQAVQTTLSEVVRPDLGLSVRRHSMLVAAMTALTEASGESIHTFRLALLQVGPEKLGVAEVDHASWQARQQLTLIASLQWALPSSPTPPEQWPAFCTAVNSLDWPTARSILTDLGPQLSQNTPFFSLCFSRLVSAALDPTDSQPDSCMPETLTRAIQWIGRELSGGNPSSWDLSVARAMYGWAYLAQGKSDHLPCIVRRIERARRCAPGSPMILGQLSPLNMSPGTTQQATTGFPTNVPLGPADDPVTCWMWTEMRARLQAELQTIHTWPADRVLTDAGHVAMAVEACTRALEGEAMPSERASAVVCASVLVSKQKKLARMARELLHATTPSTGSHPVPLASISPSHSLRPSPSSATPQPVAATLDRLCAYVPVWTSQVTVDATVIRPALGTVMSGQDAWTALVQPAVDELVKLLDEVIVKGRQTMVGGVMELMGYLVEAELAVNTAGDAMAHIEKISFNLPILFQPLAQSWLASQLPTFTGIVQRSVDSDALTDPASEHVQHSESVLAVLKCAHTIAKAVLDMPIKIPLLIPELIQTLHAGLHLYAQLICYPVIASFHASSSSGGGTPSASAHVGTIVMRINNLMQIQREWVGIRHHIVDQSRAYCPGMASMNLGTRRLDSVWLARLCKCLARVVAVDELPWGGAYLPVARTCPLKSAVIPGLESALDALHDLVDAQAHATLFSALCRATLAAWFATLWAPPRVYLDTDYDNVLEADLNALSTALLKYSKHILSTSVGREAMERLEKTQREMNALMPLPSRTLVEWIEDPRPRDEEDLAHRSKVARVLVFRADGVAKAAVKKYRLDSEVYKGMGIGKYGGGSSSSKKSRSRVTSARGSPEKVEQGDPVRGGGAGVKSSGSTHV